MPGGQCVWLFFCPKLLDSDVQTSCTIFTVPEESVRTDLQNSTSAGWFAAAIS